MLKHRERTDTDTDTYAYVSRYRLHLPPAVYFVLPNNSQRVDKNLQNYLPHRQHCGVGGGEVNGGVRSGRGRSGQPPAAVCIKTAAFCFAAHISF